MTTPLIFRVLIVVDGLSLRALDNAFIYGKCRLLAPHSLPYQPGEWVLSDLVKPSEIPFYKDDSLEIFVDVMCPIKYGNKRKRGLENYTQICDLSPVHEHAGNMRQFIDLITPSKTGKIYRKRDFVIDPNHVIVNSSFKNHYAFKFAIPYRINAESVLFRDVIEIVGPQDIPYIIVTPDGCNLVYRDLANAALLTLMHNEVNVAI